MKYGFDKFELDAAQLSLSADGVPLTQDTRPAQLIVLLLAAYPEPCAQRFLLEQLWPTTTVAHWSLARLVSDTRKLFKAAGYDGPLIQTLHGRGYRLAPEFAARLGQTEVVPSAATAPQQKTPRRPWPLIAGLALVGALALVLAWRVLQPTADNPDRLKIGEAPGVIGRVLWVDDHPENNTREKAFLEQQRIAVYTTTSTEDALHLLAMYRYDVVISDMGRGNEPLAGFKLVKAMRANGNRTPFFLYTILPSEAQQDLLGGYGGQGVAVASHELYTLVFPLFGLEPPPADPAAAPAQP